MDIIRRLEDELAKAELKLSNFSELKLTEADKVTVLLQAIPADAGVTWKSWVVERFDR